MKTCENEQHSLLKSPNSIAMDEPLLVATNPNPGGGMPDAAPPPAFKTPQQHLNPDADCPPSDRPITGREADQNPPARDSASTEKTPKATVAIVFLLFVVLRAMDRVFNKRVQVSNCEYNNYGAMSLHEIRYFHH